MQYADDTMIYTHYKINNLKVTEQNIEIELSNLLTWLNETNLVFSSAETKLMIITSKQMTRLHNFNDQVTNICCEKHWKHVLQFKRNYNNLDWDNHFNKIIKECFATTATLKKPKQFLPFHVGKHLVESLVSTKSDYFNILFINILQHK